MEDWKEMETLHGMHFGNWSKSCLMNVFDDALDYKGESPIRKLKKEKDGEKINMALLEGTWKQNVGDDYGKEVDQVGLWSTCQSLVGNLNIIL